MKGSAVVALDDMTNLKLGQLGKIAGGKANATSQTSLAADCRDSTSTTSMRGDFRCGTLSLNFISGPSNAGSARGYFKIGVKNDVGDYMGGGSSVTYLSSSLVNDLGDTIADSYYYNLDETGDGSLYETRIARNSDNAGDYEALFTLEVGSAAYQYLQDSTDYDKFRFKGTSGE